MRSWAVIGAAVGALVFGGAMVVPEGTHAKRKPACGAINGRDQWRGISATVRVKRGNTGCDTARVCASASHLW